MLFIMYSDESYSSSYDEDSDDEVYACISSRSIEKNPHHADIDSDIDDDSDDDDNYPYIRSIVDTLSSVTIPGSFANGDVFQFRPPALKVNGVEGYVGLPVGRLQAKAIIAVCAQAPYGKGQETVVDTSVRNTWELDPSQFTITNPQWNTHLESLAAVVKTELGCDPKMSVTCDLYKFLLYEQGSFFKPHRDTEKVDKMFGTLVIQLPSDYDGGELRVRHRNEEKVFDFSGSNGLNDYNYAAFYADCEHELCEVTRGYRLCLVYNLVYSGDGSCPVPIDNSEVVAEVVQDMKKWEQDDDGLPFMTYVLDHSYCEASLSFGLLKNGDRAKAEIFLEAEKQSDFCLSLGIVSLTQHYSTGAGSRYYSTDLTEKDLDEEYFHVEKTVSSDGKLLKGIDVTHDSVVPEDVFEYSETVEEEFEPCTGNAGATLDKFYSKAALFVWPRKHTILVRRGAEKAITKLNSKLSQPEQHLGECKDLAKEIVAVSSNSHFCVDIRSIVTLMSCLKQLKARDLVCKFLNGIGSHHLDLLKSQSFFEALVELGTAFGWKHLEGALVAFLESVVAREMSNACSFLSLLATGSLSSQRLKVCQKLVDVICRAVTSEPQCQLTQGVRSKDFICDLFKTLCMLQCEGKLVAVIPSFFRQPKRYSILDTLVPAALELHQTMKENSSTALTSLISQCVSTLEEHTQQAPTWFVQADLKCCCKHCTRLAAFLKDPQKKEARFYTDHGHLERQLERNCRSDVTFKTRCDASISKVLVQITKKDDHFKTYRAKLQSLDRIRPLLGQVKPPVKRQKAQVKHKKPQVKRQKKL